MFFSVPCGKGSFLADGSCIRCGYGTYQDQTGQTVCEQCPDGWTTDSWGSREVTDCSGATNNNNNNNNNNNKNIYNNNNNNNNNDNDYDK